ncbi:EamA family transporter [Acidovorax sp. DW039]|uniref:EamA family transporter n=1 Tax=Acidovorax sp. DW039 TaxID=3095606 RepID=UPI003086D4B5|nr:EamA family transporter [Acidovorax sp. DW039]
MAGSTEGSITPLVVVLWTMNMLVDTGGQLAFKAAAMTDPQAGSGLSRWIWMAQRPWLWIGVGCYIAEFLVWLAFLSLVPLSDGVLLGSINIVAVMVAGRFLFHEKLSRMRVLGILLVSAGVAVVGMKA